MHRDDLTDLLIVLLIIPLVLLLLIGVGNYGRMFTDSTHDQVSRMMIERNL